jgi:hypothetical protein
MKTNVHQKISTIQRISLLLYPVSVVAELLAIFFIFTLEKVVKHIWDPRCHSVAEFKT